MLPWKEEQNLVSSRKPQRPGQVFGYPGDGVKLERFYQGSQDCDVLTICNIDNYWIEVIVIRTQRRGRISMADLGMIPYKDGTWNQNNWAKL